MRARVGALLSLYVLAAGCGSEPQTSPAPVATIDDGVSDAQAENPVSELVDPLPTSAALDAEPGARLRTRLDAGAIAVVDLSGAIGIRPAALDFAKDGRLEQLEWSRWDGDGAAATGRMVGVVCQPDCGHGTRIEARARIALSEPVACPAGRFFDRGRIEVESGGPDAQSTSWLAAPC